MIEERGWVVAIEGDLAEVETQRHHACGQCNERDDCGTSLLTQLFGSRPVRVQVHNSIQACLGDQVVIGVQEGAFLRAAALLYGAPLLALIVGAGVGQWLGWGSDILGREPASLLSGLLGLIAGLGWVRHRTQRAGRKGAFQAEMLRRSEERSISIPLP